MLKAAKLDRSHSIVGFTLLLLVSSYFFYSSGKSTSEARPELVKALFAHVPKDKQFVKSAFMNAVSGCLSKQGGNSSHPLIEKLLLESWSGVVELETARKGKIPNQLEFDAHFANALLKFSKKNETYLAGMKGQELIAFESASKKFQAEGLEIAKCIILTAGEKVSPPAS